jgi:hypothetical protein
MVLDPDDPEGSPLPTSADRRWLWRIEGELAVSATAGAQRQLAADLRAYLAETCEHHYLHRGGDEASMAHDQCLWCSEVVFTGEAANKVARVILGMEEGGNVSA